MSLRKRRQFEKTSKMFEDAGYPTVETEWIPMRNKWRYLCKCGEIKEITPYSFKRGTRCSECRRNKMRKDMYDKTVEMFADNGCPTLEKEWRPATEKWRYICECGEVDEKRPADFKEGHRCKECGYKKTSKKLRIPDSDIKQYFEKEGEELLDIYTVEGQTFVKYKCNGGHFVNVSFARYKRGARCRECYFESNRGEGNPRWNPNLTKEERINGRNNPDYIAWTQKVFRRDSYTCKKCGGSESGTLNAHHILPYRDYKELRTCVDNGITLCIDCHKEFHKKYGYFGFDDNDLKDFLA